MSLEKDNMFKENFKKLIETSEELGWTLTFDFGEYASVCFSKFSNCGGDFSFSIDFSEREIKDDYVFFIIDKIGCYLHDYDVSYETYLWLDSRGHGRNGAPYDMLDVYNDVLGWLKEAEKLNKKLNDVF